MAESCKTCRFWAPPTAVDISWCGEGAAGYCRANPPSASHAWPRSGESDWCGAYEPNRQEREVPLRSMDELLADRAS